MSITLLFQNQPCSIVSSKLYLIKANFFLSKAFLTLHIYELKHCTYVFLSATTILHLNYFLTRLIMLLFFLFCNILASKIFLSKHFTFNFLCYQHIGLWKINQVITLYIHFFSVTTFNFQHVSIQDILLSLFFMLQHINY